VMTLVLPVWARCSFKVSGFRLDDCGVG
jgi:hypothetical protein